MARIPGKPRAKLELLRELDEYTFPHLVGDILYHTFQHTEIKVVDGPGDGRRDVHSTTPKGHIHITQCKYHRDSSQAVSPREVEELPIALFKFGAVHGMFATTARLTPQTQREFLDQYKQFVLTYLQGTEIVDLVLSNPVLASAWFDGKAIGTVRRTLVVPFIVRSMSLDKPVTLMSRQLPPDRSSQLVLDDLMLHIRRDFVPIATFDPYRAPERKTMEEQWMPWINTAICTFHGNIPIYRVPVIVETLPTILNEAMPLPSSDAMAVRFGAPYFTMLEGTEEDRTIPSGISASTVVFHDNGMTEPERDWLLPSEIDQWQFCWDGRSLTADWARWYNHNLDCCLNLQIITLAGPTSRGQVEEQRAYAEKWWNSSFFLIGTPTNINRFERGLKANERAIRRYPYGPHGEMAAWFHRNLGPGFLYEGFRELLLDGADESGDDNDSLKRPNDELDGAFGSFINRLRERAATFGLREVDGLSAYHIAAASGASPWPDKEAIVYRPCELITLWDDIPSPINPKSRRFVFEKVLTVAAEPVAIEQQLTTLTCPDISISWEIDDKSSLNGTTVFVMMELECSPGMSTSQFLEGTSRLLARSYAQVETCLKDKWSPVRSSTRAYWEQEIGILLGRTAMADA